MKKGEVWLVSIPKSENGHEQSGSRPVLLLTEVEAGIVIIIPFTSNLQALKYPHVLEIKPDKANGLKEVSAALIFQLRAIDKKRLKHKIGELDIKSLENIDGMLRKMLKL